MNILASYIHKRFKRGCIEVFDSAIRLEMPINDMLYLVFCYFQAYKSPFLSAEDFNKYTERMTFGELMEELLIARDIMSMQLSKEVLDFEGYLSVWRQDAAENNPTLNDKNSIPRDCKKSF